MGHSTGFRSDIKPTITDFLAIDTALHLIKSNKAEIFQVSTPPSGVISTQTLKDTSIMDFHILVKQS